MRTRSANGRHSNTALVTAALLAPLLTIAGCDNAACVFSSGVCVSIGTPAGALGGAAARPVLGSWILPTAPTLTRAVPSGPGIDQRSPVVLEFSESLSAASIAGAFQLRTVDTGVGSIPINTSAILVGDGRLVVLSPSAPIPLSTQMEVVVTPSAEVRDLTGQEVAFAANQVLTSYTIAGSQLVEPKLVATFPNNGAFDQSEIGEIVAVFDRPLDSATVDDDSWIVEVDGLVPSADPAPSPGSGLAIFGIPTPEPRIWRWRSVDAMGEPVPLGREVEVTLDLSPASDTILDNVGGVLPPTSISFRTASILAPSEIRIASESSDAIGISALTPGSGNELVLEVDVDAAEDGDRLDLYFIGPNPDDSGELLALRRSFDFMGPGPMSLAELMLVDLDLTTSLAPLLARFGDGNITIAASFTAGPITTPVVVFDGDPTVAGAQAAILDTVAPTIVTLDRTVSGTASYRYDAGDVVFEGLASEAITRLDVTTALASTPVGAPAFSNGNRFASTPIDVGVIPPGMLPLEYSLVVYDAAGNASATPIVGDLFLHGYVSDAPLEPMGGGDPIEVEVVDATTFAPISGALVFTHADPGLGGTPAFVGSDTTDAGGLATVTSHAFGEAGTIVSIAHAGYDIVSYHLFAAARVSVLLRPIGGIEGEVRGTLASSSSQVQFSLSTGDLVYSDGRREGGIGSVFTGSTCTTLPFGGVGITCPFGPRVITGARSGSLAAFNGVFDLPQGSFSPLFFLSTFALSHPIGPVADGAMQTVPLVMSRLLSDPAVPLGEGAIDIGVLSFDASGATGLDLLSLDEDPTVDGAVRVWAEADFGGSAPGVPAGLGISYDQGGDVWALRGALAGEVSARLGSVFDPAERISVGAELVDTHGGRSGVRRTLAELILGGASLDAPPLPLIAAPLAGANLGAGAFTIEVENALVDGALGGVDGSGLYHLRLVDAAGRGWDHYRADVLDTDGAVVFFVPDLVGAGAAPLATGNLIAAARALAWTDFDAAGLYLSDLATEPQNFATSPPVTFTVP